MGLHTGGASLEDGRYLGVSVHRGQRICSAARGGQILLSSATREIVSDDVPPGVALRDLGEHVLKDLDRPARLFEAQVEGVESTLPTPTAAQSRRLVSARVVVTVAAVSVFAGVPIVYALLGHT
jgi:class 3 adenylate cyclase